MTLFSLKAHFFNTFDLQEKLNPEPLNNNKKKTQPCTFLTVHVYELEVMQIMTDVLTGQLQELRWPSQ